ncbi:unnamed protein product [Victoria cruziana]
MQTRSGHCRLWWPSYLASRSPPDSDFLLFGWFLPASSTRGDLDVVVATTASIHQHSPCQLEANLDCVNGETTSSLKDHSKFSILGHYVAEYNSIMKKTIASESSNQKHVTDRGHCLQHSVRKSCWIQIFPDNHNLSTKNIIWVPQLHHIHQNGLLLICSFHVIIYEQPVYSLHHYSINPWCSLERERTQASFTSNISKPKWVHKLEQKDPSPSLGKVMLAINNASAAKSIFSRCIVPWNRSKYTSLTDTLAASLWQAVAIYAASASTVPYVILWICNRIVKYWLLSPLCMISSKLFRHTWRNVQVRSCQLLYWPIYLRGSGIRKKACVEYAHRDSVRRHSMWLNIIFDVILGNIFGLFLFHHLDAVCTWYSLLVHSVTNNILRSGCVWLMGVPAGFKLNTELAEMLGLILLNAFFLLQALASLWRIFRGRKWNPLRSRLDSYNYSVEEHVVGSLMLTPLLLLLPTTSVFYIFFTIINSTITLLCIFIEVSISILHATPCAEIFFRIIQPRRFPSGIWFETVSGISNQQVQGRQERVISVLNTSSASLGQIVQPHYRRIFLGASSAFGVSSIYDLLSGRRIPSSINTATPPTMPWMSIDTKRFWLVAYSSVRSFCGNKG